MNSSEGSFLRSLAENSIPAGAKDALRELIAWRLRGETVTYRDLTTRTDVETWFFDEPRSFRLQKPDYANIVPSEITDIVGTHEMHRPFVIEVPNTELIGRQGIKLTAEQEYIVYNMWRDCSGWTALEIAYDVLDAASFGTWPFRTGRPAPEETIELAVPLFNRWARNYSHWTEECLPQLAGVRHYIAETGREPTLLIPPNPPQFILDSLDAMGVEDTNVRVWNGNRVHVNHLVLPSVRRCDSATSDDYLREKFALKWVRDEVLDGVNVPDDPDSPSKILISREEDATERRVVNWDEFEHALTERGFETFVLSNVGFNEQKRIFRDTNIIIGAHGAGLTELLYAKDTAVIELFGEDYFVSTYYEMATELGHDYACLRFPVKDQNIVVDIDEVLAAVDALS